MKITSLVTPMAWHVISHDLNETDFCRGDKHTLNMESILYLIMRLYFYEIPIPWLRVSVLVVTFRDLDHDALQKCANTLDASFNIAYRRCRRVDYIGPLELRIVRDDTFNKVMNAAVTRGASPSQYKPPRCVNHPQALEVLKEGTVASFHSTITPEFDVDAEWAEVIFGTGILTLELSFPCWGVETLL